MFIVAPVKPWFADMFEILFLFLVIYVTWFSNLSNCLTVIQCCAADKCHTSRPRATPLILGSFGQMCWQKFTQAGSVIMRTLNEMCYKVQIAATVFFFNIKDIEICSVVFRNYYCLKLLGAFSFQYISISLSLYLLLSFSLSSSHTHTHTHTHPLFTLLLPVSLETLSNSF